jgi:putative CocE/NonD family hydrolase
MNALRGSFLVVVCALAAAAVADASAPPLVPTPLDTDDAFVKALQTHYTKYEYRIPMRDGVKLYTHVWAPKDASRPWPFLFVRTPYSVGPYGIENSPPADNARALRRFAPSFDLVRSGYIFVHQDVRGRMMSEGEFVDVRPRADAAKKRAKDPSAIDESTDAYDTIEWLTKNITNNNGRVGMWGISYPGFYAAQAAIDAHPALRAVSPQAPVTDWFLGDDFHHNGAFCLADAFSFYANFGRPRPAPVKKIPWDFEFDHADAYDFYLRMGPLKNADQKYLKGTIAFWKDMMTHGTRDAWWRARDPLPDYKDIRPAVLVTGGWYDAEDLWGSLATYQAMNRQSKGGRVSLVLGPWAHGGWARTEGERLGDARFDQATSKTYRSGVEFSFFESHLKGDGKYAPPEATMFETGTNEWRTFVQWPPKATTQTLWFGPGTLGKAKPAADGADRYVSDPNKPVPVVGVPGADLDHNYMTGDQRFASRRPDVVVYDSAVLAEDVTLAGPLEAEVWLSTTGSDADIVVKLIDVWPEDTENEKPNPAGVLAGGYQQLVRGEVMRGKFRNSFERPEPFVKDVPTLVKVTLPDVLHTFRTGHRIMVQVQSSWFPLIDRNPQTFVDIYNADAADFVVATHTVHRSRAHASGLRVGVLRGRLPE